MTFAAYLVRLGNEAGVYTMITHADDKEHAEKAVRHQIEVRQKVWREVWASAPENTPTRQEKAFMDWDVASAEALKVLAIKTWRAEFAETLPIFQPTSLAAWSLDKHKTVAGRVSWVEVSPAHLHMLCLVCGAEYGAYSGDYFQIEDDAYVFHCACDDPHPVLALVAPNGALETETATMGYIRQWESENSL